MQEIVTFQARIKKDNVFLCNFIFNYDYFGKCFSLFQDVVLTQIIREDFSKWCPTNVFNYSLLLFFSLPFIYAKRKQDKDRDTKSKQ